MEIDQEIFNMMLAKSMHQIARIEFRNSKFPYARGLCPLVTPARGLCPLDPRQGASPLEPPLLVNNLGPPPFSATGSAPGLLIAVERTQRGSMGRSEIQKREKPEALLVASWISTLLYMHDFKQFWHVRYVCRPMSWASICALPLSFDNPLLRCTHVLQYSFELLTMFE